MNAAPLRILLVEDNPGDARLLDLLLQESLPAYNLIHVELLADAIQRAHTDRFDIIMLDLSLPDTSGSKTFWKMHAEAQTIPIVVMTGLNDEALAAELVQAGAQDFIVKGTLDAHLLQRAIRYSIERKRAECALRQSEAKNSALLEAIPDMLLKLDRSGTILECRVPPDFVPMMPLEQIIGSTLRQFMPQDVAGRAVECLKRALVENKVELLEYELPEDDEVRYFEARFVAVEDDQSLCIVRDISALKESQNRLHHLAYHDPLTGLPNRMLFHDRLAQAVAQAVRGHHAVAVMYLDLDRFKNINDTLGHAIGDRLLRTVAERLNNCVRETDTVARLGGDEFAIVLTGIERTKDATGVAEKLLEALQPPFLMDKQEVFMSTSIGISFFWPDHDNRSGLLEEADVAMYHAKTQGRNCYRIYSRELDSAAMERLVLETSMRHALERNEFCLYYQPQEGLGGEQVATVEALIRWQSAEKGLVPPNEFIPLLEETGLILPVGEWVLRTACRQAKQWYDAGTHVRIAVNLSSRQFKQPSLVAMLKEILQQTGLPPHFLELDLTESTLMHNADSNIKQLHQLKELGVSIAIDDFGSSASSLSYLKDFAVDSIKICKSYVLNLSHSSDDQAIASSVIGLAQSMNLNSVAKGVETLQQADFLRDRNCDYLQGHFFSKALTAEEMELFLQGNA